MSATALDVLNDRIGVGLRWVQEAAASSAFAALPEWIQGRVMSA
jgi:hypothetical protein